jgi:hypothetical protein
MASSASTSDGRRNVTLGRFQILGHIATGGMGAVYRAYDPEADREVALKVLMPELLAGKPTLVERFRREAAHGARLRHENIVALYEFVEAGGTCCLVMELIDGINLHDYITKYGPLAPDDARRLLLQVVRALDYVHGQGIVHRDIKPANILLARKEGGGTVAKVTDLGLARESREDEFRLTREGCTVGTVDYMAPEQARNSSLADIRSDIYSLGCTFFHMLIGQPPFPEGTMPERLFKHAEAEPPDVRTLNPAVPDNLARILRRMLAKKPEDRYQAPADLLDELLHGPRAAAPSAGDAAPAASLPATNVSVPALFPKAPPRRDRKAGAPVPSGSNEIIAGQLAYAREQVARGQYEMGIGLLLTCCKMDPGNLQCHQALRQAVEARHDSGHHVGWPARLRGQLDRLRLRLLRRAGNHLQVLARGADVLARLPGDAETELAMGEAADALELDELALWLLVEAWKGREDEAPVNRALGRYFEKRKDFEQALGYWKRVARAVPADGEAHKKLRDLAALQTLIRTKKSEGRK